MKLVGTRSNRDAVGARIELSTAAGRQVRTVTAGSGYLSAQSLVQHFGLGSATQADRIAIAWPSGAETVIGPLAGDRRWVVVEGSAPVSARP